MERMEKIKEEEDDLWSKVLQESTRKSQIKEATVIVCGDKRCGKKVLLAQMRSRKESSQSHFGLNYSYITIRSDDELDNDLVSRMHVWLVNQVEFVPLLEQALTPETVDRVIFLICFDCSKPWAIMQTIQTWMDAISALVKRVTDTLPSQQAQALRDKLCKYVLNFKKTPAPSSDSSMGQHKEEDLQVDVPLPENVLTVNLGVPLVLVGCKSDTLKQVQESHRDGDFRLDFIQQQLRLFSLKYGATLLYTSAKESINCELLQSYLLHRLYNASFDSTTYPPEIFNKTAVFVPSGWDSYDLASEFVDFKGHATSSALASTTSPGAAASAGGPAAWNKDTPFHLVVTRNAERRQNVTSEVTVLAEDDQKFLLRQRQLMESGGYRSAAAPFAASLASIADASPARKINKDEQQAGLARKITPLSSSDLPLAKAEVTPSVLANFFQDLLSRDKSLNRGDKASSNEAARVRRSAAAKELDRMKQENASLKHKGSVVAGLPGAVPVAPGSGSGLSTSPVSSSSLSSAASNPSSGVNGNNNNNNNSSR